METKSVTGTPLDANVKRNSHNPDGSTQIGDVPDITVMVARLYGEQGFGHYCEINYSRVYVVGIRCRYGMTSCRHCT